MTKYKNLRVIKRWLQLLFRPSDLLNVAPRTIRGMNLEYSLKTYINKNGSGSGNIILDVGAHHGESAETYARWFPQHSIHSFEPCPDSFSKLEKRILDRKLYVTAHQIGFSMADDNSVLFNTYSGSPNNSLLQIDPFALKAKWDLDIEVSDSIAIKSRTIDSWITENEIQSVCLLKIDVQGAEYMVLEGGKQCLTARIFDCILIEVITTEIYHGQKPLSYYFSLFEGYKYKLRGVYEPAYDKSGSLLQFDLLFTLK